jgi:hypothetical protein
MNVEESKQLEDAEAQEPVISDLPVTAEQANETNGGQAMDYGKVQQEWLTHIDRNI